MGRFIVVDQGEIDFVNNFFEYVPELHFRLFTYPTTVDTSLTISDFSEADYAGYSMQAIAAIAAVSSNGYLGLPGSKAFSGTYSPVFPGNSGSPQQVYGMYVTYTSTDEGEVLLGAVNCFTGAPFPPGSKTITGESDITPITFTLRLWDYLSSRPTRSTFVLSGPDFTSFPDSSPQTVTATAMDELGNIDTGYNGTAYPFSSDTLATLDNNFVLTSGVGTFTVTLITTGAQILGVADPFTIPITGGVVLNVV